MLCSLTPCLALLRILWHFRVYWFSYCSHTQHFTYWIILPSHSVLTEVSLCVYSLLHSVRIVHSMLELTKGHGLMVFVWWQYVPGQGSQSLRNGKGSQPTSHGVDLCKHTKFGSLWWSDLSREDRCHCRLVWLHQGIDLNSRTVLREGTPNLTSLSSTCTWMPFPYLLVNQLVS